MDISELKRSTHFTSPRRHPWEKTRARIIEQLIDRFAADEPTNVLDMGSGDAYIAGRLAQKYPAAEIHAVDIAYEPQIIARLTSNGKASNVRFYNTFKEYQQVQKAPANIVLLLDILEHMSQPELFLDHLTKDPSLRNAIWIVTVPSFNWLFSDHDRLLKHQKRYTRSEISILLQQAGHRVISSGYFFFSLWVIRIFQKAVEQVGLRKSDNTIENWTYSSAFTKTISSLLWLDYVSGSFIRRCGFSLPGLSSFTVCQLRNSP